MDTKKQTTISLSKPPMTGKKRKKKKKAKGDNDIINAKGCTKVIRSAKKGESVPLASAITINKIEPQCSSSSSIESQKPQLKLPRIGDVISIGIKEIDIKSNDIPMDYGTECGTGPINTSGSNGLSPSVSDESTGSVVGGVSLCRLKTIANLRWINELSDEEKEKDRIEEYKNDRRERYKNDLQMKRDQREQHGDHRDQREQHRDQREQHRDQREQHRGQSCHPMTVK